jgi:CheY-like chemotaxis protein
MRKRRAILYDDDSAILTPLTRFFEDLGYDVIASADPVACPVYGEDSTCDKKRPCGDLMITDLAMPRRSGIELLQLQVQRGCKLTIRNKAVLTGNLDPASHLIVKQLGCAAFLKPVRLSVLFAWIKECEGRMDLSQPLAIQRKEPRASCHVKAIFETESTAGLFVAEVVNRSDSGLCLLVDRPLAVAQVLDLKTLLPLASDRLQVCWTQPDLSGRSLAGLSCR